MSKAKIFEYIKNNPGSTARQVSEALNLNFTTTRIQIANLWHKNELMKTKDGTIVNNQKTPTYVVNPKYV